MQTQYEENQKSLFQTVSHDLKQPITSIIDICRRNKGRSSKIRQKNG